jgi:DNA-binding MurR/RpiR family transcriptional regulator
MDDQSPPQGTDLLLAIRTLLPSLNEQEQKVGQYVLDQPNAVVRLSVSDLAQRSGVSDATVFRFCRKLGAEGYPDLKIRLAQELATTRDSTYRMVTAQDSMTEAVQKVVSADMKAIEDTGAALDYAALDEAVSTLLTARRVDIYGSGGAAVAAHELQYKLMRVGVRAVVHTDAEMQLISAALLTATDAAVGISHSGESEDVRHSLAGAKAAGARTIAITNHRASAIARLADVSLTTAAQEALAHGYPLGARVAQVLLIDVLYTAMSLQRQEEAERSQQRIEAALYHRLG